MPQIQPRAAPAACAAANISVDRGQERIDRARYAPQRSCGLFVAQALFAAQKFWVEQARKLSQIRQRSLAVGPKGCGNIVAGHRLKIACLIPERPAQHRHRQTGWEEGALHLAAVKARQADATE